MSARIQSSQLLFGELELRVSSELLLEPELMVVSRIVDGEGRERGRDHVWAPRAVVQAHERRGGAALASFLRVTHLRYIQRLLDVPSVDDLDVASAGRGKLLGWRVLGERGELLRSSGEGIPPAWLEVEGELVSLYQQLGAALELGPARRCVCQAQELAVALSSARDGGAAELRLAYLAPEQATRTRSVDHRLHMEGR